MSCANSVLPVYMAASPQRPGEQCLQDAQVDTTLRSSKSLVYWALQSARPSFNRTLTWMAKTGIWRQQGKWDSSHRSSQCVCGCPPISSPASFLREAGENSPPKEPVDDPRRCRAAGQHLRILPPGNGMAESTFGRRAVNDGKFVARLRDGARITPETLERVSVFLDAHGVDAPRRAARADASSCASPARPRRGPRRQRRRRASRNFRFFDNRQKYLLFVNTCSEKEVVAQPRRHGARQHPSRARRRCACSTPAWATARC